MNDNADILETLLTEMRLKYHFGVNNKIVKISLEDLCVLLLEYTKLIKKECENNGK